MNYKWDLSTLYTSEEDYQKDLKHFKDIIAVIGSFKGKLNEDGTLNLNPNSLTVLKNCYMEPVLKEAKADDKFQFVRNGYFCVDHKDSKEDALVFNRIVSLKSSFKI